MRKYKHWSEEEITLLKKLYLEKIPYRDMVQFFEGRTKDSLVVKVCTLKKKGFIDSSVDNTIRKWSLDMELELQDMITKNPQNLQAVFREFANKYNLTVSAVHERYYHKESHVTRIKDRRPLFLTIGKKSFARNSKINGVEYRHNLWSKIINLFGRCFGQLRS